MSPGMMITATPGALQLSAKNTEHVAGQYDDVVYVRDTTAVQKLLKLKTDIRMKSLLIDEKLVHTKNVQSKNVGRLEENIYQPMERSYRFHVAKEYFVPYCQLDINCFSILDLALTLDLRGVRGL